MANRQGCWITILALAGIWLLASWLGKSSYENSGYGRCMAERAPGIDPRRAPSEVKRYCMAIEKDAEFMDRLERAAR